MHENTATNVETSAPIRPQLISIVAYVELQTDDHAWLFDSLQTQKRFYGLEVQSLFSGDMINTATQLRDQIQQLYATAEGLFGESKALARLPVQIDNNESDA